MTWGLGEVKIGVEVLGLKVEIRVEDGIGNARIVLCGDPVVS